MPGKAKLNVVPATAKKKLSIEEVRISPAMAKSWLSDNSLLQRNVSRLTVEAFARDMKAGAWQLTHQGIAFNEEGALVDGQHRLHAIVLADVPVTMLVTRGVALEVTGPIDIGRKRETSFLMGKSSKWVAAVTELGRLATAMMGSSKATPAWISEIYEAHGEAIDAVFSPNNKMLSSVIAACAYAYPLNPEKVLSFIVQVRDGELLTRGDPAFGLRNWLASHRGKLGSAHEATFATLNCIAHEMKNTKLASVYTGESGYRWVTTKRRAMKIPNTPTVEQVDTLAS